MIELSQRSRGTWLFTQFKLEIRKGSRTRVTSVAGDHRPCAMIICHWYDDHTKIMCYNITKDRPNDTRRAPPAFQFVLAFSRCDLILGNQQIRMLIREPVQISSPANGRHANTIQLWNSAEAFGGRIQQQDLVELFYGRSQRNRSPNAGQTRRHPTLGPISRVESSKIIFELIFRREIQQIPSTETQEM